MKRTGKLLSLFLAILMLLPVTAFCFLPAEAKSEAAPAPKIVSQNLSLEDNVYILFRVSYPGVDWEKDDYGMMFWFSPQKEEDYTYENALAAPLDTAVVYGKTDNRSYDEKLSLQVATYFHGVSAKEIGDTVYARAYVRGTDGYVYSDVIAYSALKYAMRKLGTAPGYSPTQNDELKSLLRTMLEYGTAAQIYFHYRTDSPVSEGLYPHYRVTVENGVLPDGTASGEYKENTPLTVTPRQAGEAFAFSGWYEGDTKVSDSLSYSFTLTGNRTLSARFEKKESRGLTFTDAGQNTCLVSGTGDCTDAEIFIPEKSPEGKTVVGIGANAFQNTSVTLIGFSDAVTRIDENAFSGCDCLSAVYYGGTEDAFNRIAAAYGNLPLLNADLYPLYGFYGAFPITHTTDPGVQDVFWGS